MTNWKRLHFFKSLFQLSPAVFVDPEIVIFKEESEERILSVNNFLSRDNDSKYIRDGEDIIIYKY